MMVFDGIDPATGEDHASITGVSAGSTATITTTLSGARLDTQSSHLLIQADPTGAVIESHPFVPHKGMLIHVYQAFTEEWPVENDFNFLEIHQGGNMILALRIVNGGGGVAQFFVTDADGVSSQVGADDVLTQNVRHFIQVYFDNATDSVMEIHVDNVLIHRAGLLPSPDTDTTLNFRDSAGGDLTAFLKNDTGSPTLPTDTHCAGLIIQNGYKVTNELPVGILTQGAVITQDISSAEFDVFGGAPGPDLTSGTSGLMGDWDNGTRATFASNIGGAWSIVDSTHANSAAQRMVQSFNWLYDIDTEPTHGTAVARLYFGGTREAPSAPDIAFVDAPFGVVSNAHFQILVLNNLSPLPAVGNTESSVMGFESFGIEGESQIIGMVEMFVATAFVLPLPPDPATAGASPNAGNIMMCADGTLSLRGADGGPGQLHLLDDEGGCNEACVPGVISSKIINCACVGDGGIQIDIDWNLTDLQGDDIGSPCSLWRIESSNEDTTHLEGTIDGNGSLEGLPAEFGCLACHDSFMELQVGCRLPDGTIEWPDTTPPPG